MIKSSLALGSIMGKMKNIHPNVFLYKGPRMYLDVCLSYLVHHFILITLLVCICRPVKRHNMLESSRTETSSIKWGGHNVITTNFIHSMPVQCVVTMVTSLSSNGASLMLSLYLPCLVDPGLKERLWNQLCTGHQYKSYATVWCCTLYCRYFLWLLKL